MQVQSLVPELLHAPGMPPPKKKKKKTENKSNENTTNDWKQRRKLEEKCRCVCVCLFCVCVCVCVVSQNLLPEFVKVWYSCHLHYKTVLGTILKVHAYENYCQVITSSWLFRPPPHPLFYFFFFSFWLCLHVEEVPRPEIEPVPQQ